MAITKNFQEYNNRVLARLVTTEVSTHPSFQDLTGQVFGRMTLVRYAGRNKKCMSYYWCQCECGSPEKIHRASDLKTGRTISCGCYAVERITEANRERMTKHGLYDDPWYGIANAQGQRMTNPNRPEWKDYGGRGLKLGEGMETVEQRILFYREFFGSVPPEGMTVDRIDNDRGYAKDNVRLATMKEQCNNRRNRYRERNHDSIRTHR